MILFSGIVFGIGLAMSEMINPNKVQGFLDVLGNWDWTLMWVMGGALLVTVPGFWLLMTPEQKLAIKEGVVDKRLIGGSAIFGVGWGLSGYCPGPAIAIAPFNLAEAGAFITMMLVGMLSAKIVVK